VVYYQYTVFRGVDIQLDRLGAELDGP